MSRAWAWVAILGLASIAAGSALGDGAQARIRVLAAVSLVVATIWRLRRDPEMTRAPWVWLAAGGALALVSAFTRIIYLAVIGEDSAFPTPGEIPGYISYLLIITAARSFWKHRTRQTDPEAALDGFLVAAAAAVVVFTAILSDYVRDDSIDIWARSGNVTYSILTITLLGHVARLAVGPGIRNTAWRLIAASTLLIVANDLLLLLDTTGSSWALIAAGVTSPAAFFAATSAVLHPNAGDLTTAPTYRPPTISIARMVMLGGALLTLPASLLTALLREEQADLPALIVGSTMLAIATVGRIVLLFRSRERIGDLETALRESGRALLDASDATEVAKATDRTIRLVIGHQATFAATIKTGNSSHHLVCRPDAIDLTEITPVHEAHTFAALSDLVSVQPDDDGVLSLSLGDEGRFGRVVVNTGGIFDHAHQLAIQTMSAQLTQALASMELRESAYERRAEQRLRALVEQSADLVMVVDPNRIAQYASPNIDRILGVTALGVIGRDPTEHVHPEDVQQVLKHIGEPTLPHQTPVVIEARVQTAGGEYRWFDITSRDFREDAEVAGVVLTARDVTDERAAKQGLRNSEQWFRGLVQNSSDVIAVLDAEGVFKYVSPAVEGLLGCSPDELQGRSALEILSEEQIHRMDDLRKELQSGQVDATTVEILLERMDGGGLRTVEVTLTDLRDDPSVAGMVLNIRDITDRKQLEDDLRHQVLHDDLTGLGSRVQFTDQLDRALTMNRRPSSSVAVLFIDLDDFKNINDTLGHAAGDLVLVEISSRLQGRLRLHDRAARFGGDEFAVLLTDVYGDSDVTLVADRVLEELSRPIALLGREILLSVSIGVAVDEDGSQSPEELLRKADVAMYRAKDGGKNRYEIFESGMADETVERFEIANALGAAISSVR